MPSYVGIGTSITHNVEVDGNLFLQDIEGGPDSTRVPLEIFSNLVSSSVESANSRMLRLRVQNYGETNTDNSYVTDMGIRGDPGKDYFFITAPQNTSNVGDQNTFVISSTSNVGIGTTDPTSTLHVVGDELITGTLTASNIETANLTVSNRLSGGTISVSNIEATANLVVGGPVDITGTLSAADANVTGTITTSNIVAQTNENLLISSNLEVGTSNLFVNTANGNVGIGVASPSYKLHVQGDIYATGNVTGYSDRRAKSGIKRIENALEKIEQLNGYTFTMNDKRYTGLIAQEVLPVLPEAVTGSEETSYALAYGNMMGLIVEAIKEIKKKLDM
jgi:hypothetical protein